MLLAPTASNCQVFIFTQERPLSLRPISWQMTVCCSTTDFGKTLRAERVWQVLCRLHAGWQLLPGHLWALPQPWPSPSLTGPRGCLCVPLHRCPTTWQPLHLHPTGNPPLSLNLVLPVFPNYIRRRSAMLSRSLSVTHTDCIAQHACRLLLHAQLLAIVKGIASLECCSEQQQ